MTLDVLQKAKIEAIKNKNPMYKEAESAMIDAVQKASITPKGRIEITEQLIDEVLIKYQKTIQEMIDTCPAERTDLLEKYQAEMEVVKLYAPQLMTNKGEIERTINDDCVSKFVSFFSVQEITTSVLKLMFNFIINFFQNDNSLFTRTNHTIVKSFAVND